MTDELLREQAGIEVQGKLRARRRASRDCPYCGEMIADDDVVVSTRGRPTMHVRCWTPRTPPVSHQDAADNNLSP